MQHLKANYIRVIYLSPNFQSTVYCFWMTVYLIYECLFLKLNGKLIDYLPVLKAYTLPGTVLGILLILN